MVEKNESGTWSTMPSELRSASGLGSLVSPAPGPYIETVQWTPSYPHLFLPDCLFPHCLQASSGTARQSVTMSSTEDLVRTFSRLVFACVTPGTATLKLFDPTTGVLSDYLLVKVMPEASPQFGRRPRQAELRPPPLVFFNELVERLKTVVLEDIPRNNVEKVPSPLLAPRIPRSTPHAQLSRMTAVALFDSSRSEESDASSPEGPLAQLKRALFNGGKGITQGIGSRHSPSLLSFFSGASSSLLAPSDADNSSFTLDNSGSLHKPTPSSSPCLPRDMKFMGFENTSSDTDLSPVCPSAPRLLGLGFSNILKDDGTPFDGLGTLADSQYSCMSSVSPSDEARARAAERRGLRGPPVNASSPSPLACPRSSKVVRFSAVSGTRDEDFGFTAKMFTPIRATSLIPRPVPAAPPRRVIGRLPVSLEKRPGRRQSNPKVERNPTTPGYSQPARVVAGVSARRDGRRSSKRSPVLAGTPPGEQLRLWSNWMTPVGKKDGERRPSWRP